MRPRAGFSIIELLIVVAIIVIIAAIAIPNLLQSRMAANEASAAGMNTNYVTGAAPLQPGSTGNKNFCSTAEQVCECRMGLSEPR